MKQDLEQTPADKIPSTGIFVFRFDPSRQGIAFKIVLVGVLALLLFSVW